MLGHRNGIVVADLAYPAQSRPGIETVYIGGDQAEIVAEVFRAVDAAEHVGVPRPHPEDRHDDALHVRVRAARVRLPGRRGREAATRRDGCQDQLAVTSSC